LRTVDGGVHVTRSLIRGGVPLAVAVLVAGVVSPASAQVHYDIGRRVINGVQLLQDYRDSTAYYYLPQYPRLAQRSDGSFELLVLKYVGDNGDSNGGLLHALVQFDLPPGILEDLEKELQREVEGARLIGPVPLLQATDDGDAGVGSFRVVSSVLSDAGDGGLTRSLVTSGRAPLLPGSKAVVAALLSPEGATLLWNSLTGPTSDVSIAIQGYYEAALQAYNATVHAEMNTLYEHFSEVINQQGLPLKADERARNAEDIDAGAGKTKRGGRYSRDFISTVVDSLARDGIITVDVFDRTKSFDLDASAMEGILQVVTQQLTEIMFDATGGWAQDPPKEKAVAYEDLAGRQPEGFLTKVFGTSILSANPLINTNRPYYSDDLYVLKNRADIRTNVFNVVLNTTTTVRVPVDAAGNLGGLYEALGEDPDYFRIVNLDDPAFEYRTVHFQVDGDYVDAFSDLINFVSVNVRKRYEKDDDFTEAFTLTHSDMAAGNTIVELSFPRLGEEDAGWHDYEYQTVWSLQGLPSVRTPVNADAWITTSDAAVSLSPPFEKREIQIDVDREAFLQRGIASAVIRFATVLAGQPVRQREVVVRADGAEATHRIVLYNDPGEQVAYRITWYGQQPEVEGDLKLLKTNYLYVSPRSEQRLGMSGATP